MPTPPTTDSRNGLKRANRCPEWKLLAHLYHTTGDESYAETFAQLFDSWVMQAVAPEEDVSGGETLCWRTIECGIRMGANWPLHLIFFLSQFSFYG
ncbi:MAG: heparinase II/III family protein [Clostridia bacterium]